MAVDTEYTSMQTRKDLVARMAVLLGRMGISFVAPATGKYEALCYSATDGAIVGTLRISRSNGWWYGRYTGNREYAQCGLCGNYEATHAQGTLCSSCYYDIVKDMCESAVRNAIAYDSLKSATDVPASVNAVETMARATESVTAYAARLSSGQAIHRVRGKAVKA